VFVPLKQIYPKPGIPLKKIYVLLLRDYNAKTHDKIALLFLLQKFKFLPLGPILDPIILWGQGGWFLCLTIYLRPIPRSRMSGDIPPVPELPR
jgi:hypothetical protein